VPCVRSGAIVSRPGVFPLKLMAAFCAAVSFWAGEARQNLRRWPAPARPIAGNPCRPCRSMSARHVSGKRKPRPWERPQPRRPTKNRREARAPRLPGSSMRGDGLGSPACPPLSPYRRAKESPARIAPSEGCRGCGLSGLLHQLPSKPCQPPSHAEQHPGASWIRSGLCESRAHDKERR
jgi:hypothetical protein